MGGPMGTCCQGYVDGESRRLLIFPAAPLFVTTASHVHSLPGSPKPKPPALALPLCTAYCHKGRSTGRWRSCRQGWTRLLCPAPSLPQSAAQANVSRSNEAARCTQFASSLHFVALLPASLFSSSLCAPLFNAWLAGLLPRRPNWDRRRTYASTFRPTPMK